MKKPTGQYRCIACGKVWDGSKLVLDPQSTAARWTCGDYFCGGNVTKVEQPALPLDDKPEVKSWDWSDFPGFAKNRNKKRR